MFFAGIYLAFFVGSLAEVPTKNPLSTFEFQRNTLHSNFTSADSLAFLASRFFLFFSAWADIWPGGLFFRSITLVNFAFGSEGASSSVRIFA